MPPGSSTTTLAAATPHSEDFPRSADCHQPDGRVQLAAGAPGKRATLRNARILIHQPHGGAQGQSIDIEIWAREIAAQRDHMVDILARHSGQPHERITRDIDRDYILRGEDAVDYGLVDHVLEHRHSVATSISDNGQHSKRR